jgi:ABC-type multidrug transport system ATPase subunit
VEAGSTRILRDITLRIRAGEFVALLGPSGCGKSTLLKTLTGIMKPSSGAVRLEGVPDGNGAGGVGYVPQDDIVHTALRVRDALWYAALLRLPEDLPDKVRRARVEEVLATLGLREHAHKRVRQLSGGQRKRVSVGVELLTDPRVLLMDEPTSGLDPALEEQLMAAMRRLTTADRITVLSTHAMASLATCDLVVVVARGQLCFVGPPAAAPPHFGVADYNAVFRRLVNEPVHVFTNLWDQSPWKTRVLAPGRKVGREL